MTCRRCGNEIQPGERYFDSAVWGGLVHFQEFCKVKQKKPEPEQPVRPDLTLVDAIEILKKIEPCSCGCGTISLARSMFQVEALQVLIGACEGHLQWVSERKLAPARSMAGGEF